MSKDEEAVLMMYERIEVYQNALIEVDYLISYGQILEARTLIERTIGDNQTLNNQRGIKQCKKE